MKQAFMTVLVTAALTSALADADYPETIHLEWAKLVAFYNSEMTNPDKVVGMSLSSEMVMGPTMSHKKAAWYYGRVNFLLGQYSVNPTKEREKAVLAEIRKFLLLAPSTNAVQSPKPGKPAN